MKNRRQSRYKGFRKPGAGRKARWPDVLHDLKAWVEEQRSYGHSVTKEVLCDRYLVLLQAKETALKASAREAVDPLKKAELEKSEKEARNESQRILKESKFRNNKNVSLVEQCELKALKPDLTTKLSLQEEFVRSVLTWQSFDKTVWKACFASLECLAESVADAAAFRQHVSSMVLLFSDQIPLWVKAGSEKELFAKFEHKPVQQSELRENLKQHHSLALADPARGTSLKPLDMPLQASGDSGLKQKRSLKEPSADRYRITYEARQAVYNYCSDQPLQGKVLPGLLVVHGVHARLNNISQDGKFISDESFWFKGNLVQRKAGESAGKLLLPYRQLKSLKPQLFEAVSVMQQPAANVDSVIFHWSQLELSALAPCCVHQRDCFSASWSPTAAQSLYATQTLQCVICPKMTASLQLTDTDYSRAFKSLCREAMARTRRDGQEALLKAGRKDVWNATVEDCISAVVVAQEEMSKRQHESDWICKGLRRNGMLAYKPDLQAGEMKPLSDEPAADYPQGSGRYPSDWLKDRYSWVRKEDSGKFVPLEPDWSLIPGSKEISDLVEYQYWSAKSETPEEDEALLSIEELPEALQWPCIESGILQVPLSLQKLAWKLSEEAGGKKAPEKEDEKNQQGSESSGQADSCQQVQKENV